MEGSGGGSGSGPTHRAVGMHWAPATSAPYPQPILPPPCGPSHQMQQHQQGLICLKLAKRPCFWGGDGGGQVAQGSSASVCVDAVEGKRKEKTAAEVATVPRCQVEGCDVALAGVKEYHRRHKICEMHSKAPWVVVHGAEQRFCQQCSRFHAISEFDDAKRSCRRRLAGHNERRRKSNACSDAMSRGSAHPHGVPAMGHGFPPYDLPTSPASVLSLLSSTRTAGPWMIPTPDISARSSAALDELIAENRALLAWQFFADRSPSAAYPMAGGWHAHVARPPPHEAGAGGHLEPAAGHVTLDLMQQATSAAAAGGPLRPVAERPAKVGGDGAGCTSNVSTSSSSMEGARVV